MLPPIAAIRQREIVAALAVAADRSGVQVGSVLAAVRLPAWKRGIGVKTTDGADAIADRFYEEVRFWWAKLHPPDIDATQTA
jgi:hypothetical protein